MSAREFASRAERWAEDETSVRAAVVFGSVARGEDNEFSDLDLILVTEPGAADDLWARRADIATSIMGGVPAYVQEPHWQGEHRYQAWDGDGYQLDLTIAEEPVPVFGGLARGFTTLVDRDGVAERLTAQIERWSEPEFDAAAMDGGTWVWLAYLQGRLRHGERFAVRAGLTDTLMGRVVPLLGGQWHSAHAQLAAVDLERVHGAMPTSDDPTELGRALRETARVYDWALDRWVERTGRERPSHPLASMVLRRLDA
ncbi:nucleotidyltransferase domain-containing protein [Aestuariimicrobium ganziense]|uniref:nucleotidyltransferase domain-containing protein n=1 Tax=Aestuariimicrobium ganziense TaxID=2773677 RepID=UPI001942B0C8|nr:nucleotidyltransferase domain-containing protein [Aestuariimicrobium ganziense]